MLMVLLFGIAYLAKAMALMRDWIRMRSGYQSVLQSAGDGGVGAGMVLLR